MGRGKPIVITIGVDLGVTTLLTGVGDRGQVDRHQATGDYGQVCSLGLTES
jgi:hypothetical protein